MGPLDNSQHQEPTVVSGSVVSRSEDIDSILDNSVHSLEPSSETGPEAAETLRSRPVRARNSIYHCDLVRKLTIAGLHMGPLDNSPHQEHNVDSGSVVLHSEDIANILDNSVHSPEP